MASIDTIGGGNIEPRGLEEEMRSAYLDYAMSVIVGRALPDVRDGLKPVHRRVLYAMNELGLRPPRRHVKCATIVGEVMGKYHPHGDSAIYDTLVPDGAGLLDALPAHRRARELRQHRRLGRGGHALHRGAPRPARHRDAARHRPGHGRLRAQLRRLASRSRWCCPRASRTCSSTAAPGSRSGMATNIPPHNLREVVAATIAYIDDPGDRRRGPDEARQGPRLPDRWDDPRPRGDPRRLRHRPRARCACRPRPTSSRSARARRRSSSPSFRIQVRKGGDGGLIEKIADARPREEDLRDQRHRATSPTATACGS